MAPSSGTHLVSQGVRAIKQAISRSHSYLRSKLYQQTHELVPVHIQNGGRHPIHRLAALKQARSARFSQGQYRLFSSLSRKLSSAVRTAGRDASSSLGRDAFPPSATRAALARTTHAPFSSPLRPNLTGGCLPRSAGGYGLGSGGARAARHFSSGGAAQAQVVHNVSAGVRAFLLKGYTPLYDGMDGKGRSKFRAVGRGEREVEMKLGGSKTADVWSKGTNVEFRIAPVVTALGVAGGILSGGTGGVLDEETTLSGLAGDFARQLRDLAAVHADLRKLAKLGSLALTNPEPGVLRVRFPGCDGRQVLALCDEVGVARGVVREDEAWSTDSSRCSSEVAAQHGTVARDVEMALLFPMAPSDGADYFLDHPPARKRRGEMEWRSMLSETGSGILPGAGGEGGGAHSASPAGQLSSPAGSDGVWVEKDDALSSPRLGGAGFEEVELSEADEDGRAYYPPVDAPTGYEGVEGIYRFLAELEAAEHRR